MSWLRVGSCAIHLLHLATASLSLLPGEWSMLLANLAYLSELLQRLPPAMHPDRRLGHKNGGTGF